MNRTALFRQCQHKGSGIMAGPQAGQKAFLNKRIDQPGRGAFFDGKNPMQIGNIQLFALNDGVQYNKLMKCHPFAKGHILSAAACRLGQTDQQIHQRVMIENRLFHVGCNIQLYFHLSRRNR